MLNASFGKNMFGSKALRPKVPGGRLMAAE